MSPPSNYNRDIEIFPVLNAIFQRIYGSSPYKSPTDMGVNMAGNCIIDDDACRRASEQEVIRRYYATACLVRQGLSEPAEIHKQELIMNQLNVSSADRPVVAAACAKAEETGQPRWRWSCRWPHRHREDQLSLGAFRRAHAQRLEGAGRHQ